MFGHFSPTSAIKPTQCNHILKICFVTRCEPRGQSVGLLRWNANSYGFLSANQNEHHEVGSLFLVMADHPNLLSYASLPVWLQLRIFCQVQTLLAFLRKHYRVVRMRLPLFLQ